MKVYAATDLGGSKIYTVLLNEKGTLLSSRFIPTLAREGPDVVLSQISESINELMTNCSCQPEDLVNVGICTAGFYDRDKKILVSSPNLDDWENVPISAILTDKLGVPIAVENDANAAAIGETRYGAGKGHRNLAYVSVGTGIGAGLILNGSIYHGNKGFAGELGHTVIMDEGGLPCGCGKKGCLETLASGTAIGYAANIAVKMSRKTILKDMVTNDLEDNLTAHHVYQAVKQGDVLAREIVEEAAYYFGIGLVNLVNLLNPSLIIVGGGVAEMGEAFFQPVKTVLANRVIPSAAKTVKLTKGTLGLRAGVIGMLSITADIPLQLASFAKSSPSSL